MCSNYSAVIHQGILLCHSPADYADYADFPITFPCLIRGNAADDGLQLRAR